jgi:PAS domain S-box-containing protein
MGPARTGAEGVPDRDEQGGPRSVAQLNMLHSLAARLNELQDARLIGEAITSELRTIVDYHNCRVFVLQPDGETLQPIAFEGLLSEYRGQTFDRLVTKVGRGITGHVAKTGRSYYAPDAAADPRSQVIVGTADLDESMLAVPLISDYRVLGVIVLSKLGIDKFDEQDMRLMEVLASHAAGALERAHLLQREREAAQLARESEARKSAIIESAPDCVIVMDHRGMLVEFNPAGEEMFGYAREDVIGREMAELIIPPSLRHLHREGIERYLVTGHGPVLGKRTETIAMRSDGSEFPVELAITKVDLPGPPLFTGYIRDITERKRGEIEIERALDSEREAVERLRALDEMKNTFLQAVSHDLRTPLAAILGLALTLDRRDLHLSEDEQHDLMGRLAANARKLDRILSNLLDLDRLVRGVVEPNRVPTDVGALIRLVLAEADFLEGHPVTLDLGEPGGSGEVIAFIDGPKVERIVENLLVNAARHTPSGTPVWIRVERDATSVAIVVEDGGPGVPEQHRKDVFEPFHQGVGEQPSPGVGIGLSLVSRFAQIHGGRAWVEEREGGGASFHVVLNDEPQAEPAGPVAPAA